MALFTRRRGYERALNVLIADDEPMILKSMPLSGARQCRIVAAATATKAEESNIAEFDVVIADLELPVSQDARS